jgi:hypothetical protein
MRGTRYGQDSTDGSSVPWTSRMDGGNFLS